MRLEKIRLAVPLKRLLWLVIILLSACQGDASGTTSPPATIAVAVSPTATHVVETYQAGEPVTFEVDNQVYVCQYYKDQIPYTIWQVTATETREVALRHSCIGIGAQGQDEYCEAGEIRIEYVEVGNCSDDIGCGTMAIQETFTWDQQEYVRVMEECAGETIVREVRQSVPVGKYQIVIEQQTAAGEIVTRVIKEFMIVE